VTDDQRYDLSGRTVLVTGADGFIGSHLVEQLLTRGSKVRAGVLYNSFNSWGWLDTLPRDLLRQIDVFTGDVRDPQIVRSAVKGMDRVFHLAALIAIPFSYQAPESYLETNVRGTLNVLQACQEHGTERVIVTSTSEVYGTARYVPIDEAHPHQGQSPYSASKIGADRMSEAYFRCFDTPVVIARPFNTYGPRQSARAIIPTLIVQLLSGTKEIHMGSLHPTRDLNYVEDVCHGLIALAECPEAVGLEVNIGSGTEISMADLAERLIDMVGSGATVVSEERRERPRKSEVERLVCDNSLLRRLTNWAPTISLDEGLERTLAWFRIPENLGKYKAELYNV
jgi:NAD dependent epimerase/dehydratase